MSMIINNINGMCVIDNSNLLFLYKDRQHGVYEHLPISPNSKYILSISEIFNALLL